MFTTYKGREVCFAVSGTSYANAFVSEANWEDTGASLTDSEMEELESVCEDDFVEAIDMNRSA